MLSTIMDRRQRTGITRSVVHMAVDRLLNSVTE
jgi:hypothetical protein